MRSALLRTMGAGARLTTAQGACFDVVFDNEYVLAGEVEERQPAATMRTTDVECAKLKKESVVRVFNPFENVEKPYRVRRLEPDGTGMTLVVLGAD